MDETQWKLHFDFRHVFNKIQLLRERDLHKAGKLKFAFTGASPSEKNNTSNSLHYQEVKQGCVWVHKPLVEGFLSDAVSAYCRQQGQYHYVKR